MSGITADNVERSSGLIKAASVGPSTSSSDPTVSTNPSSVGTRIINTTSGEVFVCTDITAGENVWKGQLGTTVEPPKYFGARGVVGGGYVAPSGVNTIDYFNIASLGNAVDFGDRTEGKSYIGACSNGTRGLWNGGSPSPYSNVIDYVTISSVGNATDFGDLTVSRGNQCTSVSDGTKGLFGGGQAGPPGVSNVIDYVNIASTGDSTDFGDLTTARQGHGSASNGSRGIWFAGHNGTAVVDVIDYVTISSLGNATDFGNATVAGGSGVGGTGNKTRGVFAAGSNRSNIIDYIVIASTGNATDFGDLTRSTGGLTACSDGTKAVWTGGDSPAASNVMDYVVIASTGNASDFGDLSQGRDGPGATSGDAS